MQVATIGFIYLRFLHLTHLRQSASALNIIKILTMYKILIAKNSTIKRFQRRCLFFDDFTFGGFL